MTEGDVGNEALTGQPYTDRDTDIRLGIIGTGRIARRFVPECGFVEGIEITAVYNPHEGSAERFVEEVWDIHSVGMRLTGTDGEDTVSGIIGRNGHPEASEEIEAFLDAVDAVYIASPHETHYGYIMEALEHGKHVMCEKPMTLNREEAEEAFLIAKKNGLILMEAIKTAYCPGYRKLLEVAASGIIGEVKYIESRFTKLENPDSRELTDMEYGGSFTEMGSYVCLPILDMFGSGYNDIRFSRINNEKGIDIFTKTEFIYGDRIASAICGLGVKAEGGLMIAGSKGYIKVDSPWWKTSHFEVHFEDPSEVISYDEEFEDDGLRYELKEFIRRVEMKSDDDKYNNHGKMRSICMADLMEKSLLGR